jgi:2-dehydropantoate 2-reductase
VHYFSGARRLEIGDPVRPADERAAGLAAFITQHGFNAVASEDPLTAAWRKLVLVSTANALTAATRKPFGEIVAPSGARSAVATMLREAVTVARGDGAALAPDYADEALSFLTELGPTLRSSMLHDVERGRRTEVDFLNGEVVRRGRAQGVPTPLHEFAWLVLGDGDTPEVRA